MNHRSYRTAVEVVIKLRYATVIVSTALRYNERPASARSLRVTSATALLMVMGSIRTTLELESMSNTFEI